MRKAESAHKTMRRSLPPTAAGQRYGRLVAIECVNPHGHAKWIFKCDCGRTLVAIAKNVRRGMTKSCGCLHAENVKVVNRTHGMSYSSEHKIWEAMKRRCLNPNDTDYHLYGGRGIEVCDRWKNSFADFLSDMGRRPQGTSIDRIDNDKGYEPGNVRWATASTQVLNRRSTLRVEYNGTLMTLKDACAVAGLPYSVVLQRIRKLRWHPSLALSTLIRCHYT